MQHAVMAQAASARTRAGARATSRSPAPSGVGASGAAEFEDASEPSAPTQTQGGGVSALVRSGYIINPASGRAIKIGGDM